MPAHARRTLLAAALLAAASALAPATAIAQGAYPSRPVRLVIPFPPGGPTDIFGRLFAARLGEVLGQSVVPDNRAGAGGVIGADAAAKSSPDGYTLLFGTGSIPTAAAMSKSLPFDPRKDLEPVAQAGIVPLVLLAAPDQPKSFAGLLATIKAAPGKFSYGSAGPGTTTHLAGEMLRLRAGVDILHVPYKGSGPALQDTVAGRQAFLFETITASKALYTAGKLQLLAVATKNRSPLLPDLPTIAEAGVPGMDAYTWNMLFAPAGTPRPVIEQLNKAANQVLGTPAFAKQMADLATEVVSNSTPASSRAFLMEQLDLWAAVVKEAGLKAE